MTSPIAGLPAPRDLLVDPAALERAYYERRPDPASPRERVTFGTSGHRGSSLHGTFTESHILAITQALCDFRRDRGLDGPLFIGHDTHALSEPAERTALEVLAANGVAIIAQAGDVATPTPVISHAILAHNRGRAHGLADGIVITPSHNPPEDGGFKYNGPNGGPADTDVTRWVQDRANAILEAGNQAVRRATASQLRDAVQGRDLAGAYVDDLPQALDMDAIRGAGLHLAADALGGSAAHCWFLIAERYGLDLDVLHAEADPTFSFMTVDHDGRIRMDCSSPWAMAGMLAQRDRYRLAMANDPDADRHGIVTPGAGLLNPNHYLAAAIDYLLEARPGWDREAVIGKTLVSSSMIDRVVHRAGRTLFEVPVGFKWFAPGLSASTCCFGGEESAGASFLRRDGGVWTTDKDGILLALLAVEITARTGRDPGERYAALERELGTSSYARIDTPADARARAALGRLSPGAVTADRLAGEPITARLTEAPGNGAPVGGLKVVAKDCWFAARPSGTEDIYKVYAESFRGPDHLQRVLDDARSIVQAALAA